MSALRSILVRHLEEQYISEIVDIHQSVLGYTLNSRLGKQHLGFIYRFLLNDPECCVLVAFHDQEPIGVISGVVDMERTRHRLMMGLIPSRWINILFALLRNPSLVAEWFKGNIIGKPVYFSNHAVNAILTTLAIRTDWQRKGVGSQLIESLQGYFLSQKIKVYRLDTLSTNFGARSFYKNLGFQEIEERADSIVLVKRIME